MAFGLTVKNDYGDTVIDGEWPNYTKMQEGVIPFTIINTNGNGDGKAVVVISLITPGTDSSPPILLIRPNGSIDGTVELAQVTTLGYPGNWTGFNLIFTQPYNSPTSVKPLQYKIYGVQPAPEAAWGMRVFSPSGAIVFDSSRQQLRLSRVITSPDWVLTSQYPGTNSNYGSWGQTHVTTLPADTYISISTISFDGIYASNPGALYLKRLRWGGGTLTMTTSAFMGGYGYGPPLAAQPVFCG